jgi:hypothetical protein
MLNNTIITQDVSKSTIAGRRKTQVITYLVIDDSPATFETEARCGSAHLSEEDTISRNMKPQSSPTQLTAGFPLVFFGASKTKLKTVPQARAIYSYTISLTLYRLRQTEEQERMQ